MRRVSFILLDAELVPTAWADVTDKHAAIMKLERSIGEVAEMFQDLALLVESQVPTCPTTTCTSTRRTQQSGWWTRSRPVRAWKCGLHSATQAARCLADR